MPGVGAGASVFVVAAVGLALGAVAVGKTGNGVAAGARMEQPVPSASSVTIAKRIRYRDCKGGCFQESASVIARSREAATKQSPNQHGNCFARNDAAFFIA